jgi:hypothetical protein
MATSVSAYAVSKQELRARRMGTRLLEQFDTGHLRHPLVRGDQRHRLVA